MSPLLVSSVNRASGSFTNDVARWANLSLDERIAERMAAILFAADEIRDMVVLAGDPSGAPAFYRIAEQVHELVSPLLPLLGTLTVDSVGRDPELERALLKLDVDLARSETTPGNERDTLWEPIEDNAAPYALAFYYEIRRLDNLRLFGYSLILDETDEHSE